MAEYSELKRLALASLECQQPTHQLAYDHAFGEAATPGVVWQLLEKYEALAVLNNQMDRLACANKALSDSFRAERDQLQAENEALRKERDKLAEENQGLLEDFGALL
jgi:FtsZ-binding cell division protein ZapB